MGFKWSINNATYGSKLRGIKAEIWDNMIEKDFIKLLEQLLMDHVYLKGQYTTWNLHSEMKISGHVTQLRVKLNDLELETYKALMRLILKSQNGINVCLDLLNKK